VFGRADGLQRRSVVDVLGDLLAPVDDHLNRTAAVTAFGGSRIGGSPKPPGYDDLAVSFNLQVRRWWMFLGGGHHCS
jgi:hypothetical protein